MHPDFDTFASNEGVVAAPSEPSFDLVGIHYPTLPYPTLPYPTLPFPTCPALPCPTLPYSFVTPTSYPDFDILALREGVVAAPHHHHLSTSLHWHSVAGYGGLYMLWIHA